MVPNDYRNIRGNPAAKKFFKGTVLSLAKQAQMLEQTVPNSSTIISRNKLVWKGQVQPTPTSCAYFIKIEYTLNSAPLVWVVDPPLQRRKVDEPIPHMYEQERLCLHYPPANEWNSTRPLHLTILPWAAMWLMFYEYWLVTGSWEGGGIHPSVTATETNYKSRS